jgi:electron transfer flavoprotein alpha subunit
MMVTIRPNAFATVENAKTAEVVKVDANADDIRKVIKYIGRQVSERPELTEADIIVSCDSGMKGRKTLKFWKN